MKRRTLLATLGLPLLPACSTLLPPPSANWTLGRLLLRVDASAAQAAQSFTAGFELRGDASSGELRLLSPLGTRVATALWSPQQVRLLGADGAQSFASLDELSQRVLGQSVPLAALPDWLAGRPWAGAPHDLQTQGFVQLGWQVNTSARAAGQLEARRSAAPAVLLRVRLDTPA